VSALPSNVLPNVPPPESEEFEFDYDALVTEGSQHAHRIFLEKQHRLLTRPLYASWPGLGDGQPFLVLVNVGWFYRLKSPAVVPDCLLSLDVTCPQDLHAKQGHSYYQWEAGKPPEVVIEIVSDQNGGEESQKQELYARLGVPYYAIFDPGRILGDQPLRCYERAAGRYRPANPGPWPAVGLGLRLWPGKFEGHEDVWLRWCDVGGEIIPTGEERAAQLAECLRGLEVRILQHKSAMSPGRGQGGGG
jgi:hypothetical protein